MTADCDKILKVLLRSGTDQEDRYKTDLSPDSVQLHGFGIEEWMAFAYNFASHVNYFNADSWQIPDGDWQTFFKNEQDTVALLKELEESDELTPHLTLFICFLKLIELSTERLNGLTAKHLDFFYEDILQIEKLPAQEDKVHVLFELSKNALQEKIEAGTQLNGDKDANGKLRTYELKDEFVANQAKIAELKNIYFDPDSVDPVSGATQSQYYMKAADVANSADGKGDAFADTPPSWYAFGYNHNRTESKYAELDNASIGFAVASHVLSLSEGTRHVQIDVKFADPISALTFDQLKNAIDVHYTTEKGWVGPLQLKQNGSGITATYKTEVVPGSKLVRFYIELDSGQPSVTGYDASVHEQKYDTENPVFKFIVKPFDANGLDTYKLFSKKISSIDIKVEAQGMKKLVLENDQGNLNPEKPMYPYTTIPKKGSNFNIYHEEIFSKKWDSATVDITWKNVPDDLIDWYAAYVGEFRSILSRSAFSSAFKSEINSGKAVFSSSPILFTNKIIANLDEDLKVTKYIKYNNNWVALGVKPMFTEVDPYNSTYTFPGTSYSSGNTEYLRISLNQSFLHEMYPRLYAVSLVANDDNTIIPNEPYTPFAEEIVVSYTAHDSINLNSTTEDTFNSRTIQLFHHHPFGQTEEHSYLKSLISFTNNNCTLTPVYCRGGEFYIGIENADQLQKVSLLIQVFEGSENTLLSNFEGNPVQWDILCNNAWKKLDSTLLSKNEIDNFLRSGIVEFKIPKEATTDNTLLPEGLFWVRAKMLKSYDAVCRILGIHAQAALAEFVDNNNELSHLEKGLPAETISKFIQRTARVKGIQQPYNSFGGKPEETQENYYRRVSERLRHKNRSINLWDYEHMVLQEFPDIYNVKCLNHTYGDSYTAAGHVTLVVIPDTVNKNVYDIFQPRVSTAYLNEIKEYIDQFNSLHVKQHVINPDYEPITIDLKVKFLEGYDEALYKIQLNEDITKLLSPWAFDTSVQVEFGNTLHRSVLIDYIEELYYVDYVQDVRMLTKAGIAIQNYQPASPKAIMVSAKQHKISTDIVTCESTTKIITEGCQQ